MEISDDALKEFVTICRREYGIDLSEGGAQVRAMQLLLLYELISKPLPSERKATSPSGTRASAAAPGQKDA